MLRAMVCKMMAFKAPFRGFAPLLLPSFGVQAR